jgi:hypothetical protein
MVKGGERVQEETLFAATFYRGNASKIDKQFIGGKCFANSYSKAMLRTVAQEWAAAHKNVHYFPSCEIVLNSGRAVTWQEDLGHVQGKMANHIMRFFLDNYLE